MRSPTTASVGSKMHGILFSPARRRTYTNRTGSVRYRFFPRMAVCIGCCDIHTGKNNKAGTSAQQMSRLPVVRESQAGSVFWGILLCAEIVFVGFDHLLERVSRTTFGISTLFQFFEIFFTGIPGKDLDIEPERAVFFRCD